MAREDTHCIDCMAELCGEYGEFEWFMLRDPVWYLTGLTRTGGSLCIGCTEVRIERQLVRADFDQALSINEPSPIMSDRLLDRLGLQKVVVKTEESTD